MLSTISCPNDLRDAQRYKMPNLCEQEIAVLRGIYTNNPVEWGACVGAVLEFLVGEGLVSPSFDRITTRGIVVLQRLDGNNLDDAVMKAP